MYNLEPVLETKLLGISIERGFFFLGLHRGWFNFLNRNCRNNHIFFVFYAYEAKDWSFVTKTKKRGEKKGRTCTYQ